MKGAGGEGVGGEEPRNLFLSEFCTLTLGFGLSCSTTFVLVRPLFLLSPLEGSLGGGEGRISTSSLVSVKPRLCWGSAGRDG